MHGSANTEPRQSLRLSVWLGMALVLWCGAGNTAWADELFSPMLTLRMGDRGIEMDRDQIAALPQARVSTGTALHPDPIVWEGPLMRDVLALLDVPEGEVVPVRITSWDDYRVEFTSEDSDRWDVILAWRANGSELGVEELGPLRIIYPLDQFEELRDQRFHYRWVWLLNSIEVLQ